MSINEKKKDNVNENHHDGMNLKGTFLMVMTLGVIMVLSWFGAFMLLMERMQRMVNNCA